MGRRYLEKAVDDGQRRAKRDFRVLKWTRKAPGQ